MEVGRRAPDFALKDQHGQEVSLCEFAGTKNVLLVFYPFAFSGVCTGELRELRDRLADVRDEVTELLAVSCDHMFSLRAFADRDGYDFSLLSDFWPHGQVSGEYGVFNATSGSAGRASFVIDRGGIVRWQVANDISDARSIDDYRRILNTLR